MTEHTPIPWLWAELPASNPDYRATGAGLSMHLSSAIRHDGGEFIAFTRNDGNAAFIVRAVNTHALMLDALRAFADEAIGENFICHVGLVSMADCGRCGRIMRAREAIRAAEGKTVNG